MKNQITFHTICADFSLFITLVKWNNDNVVTSLKRLVRVNLTASVSVNVRRHRPREERRWRPRGWSEEGPSSPWGTLSSRCPSAPRPPTAWADSGRAGSLQTRGGGINAELERVFIIAMCNKTCVTFSFVLKKLRAIYSYRIVTIDRSVAAEKVWLSASGATRILWRQWQESYANWLPLTMLLDFVR